MRKSILRAAAAALATSIPIHAAAATVPAAGYIYERQLLSQLTEGCVARAEGGDFVGIGPALSFPAPGGTRSIVFVSGSGSVHTVATGLNSIADCVYDATSDTLYVTDSGQEFSGATTGDTVFAIAGDSMSVPVAGLEVLPSGSIQQAFSIDLFGDGLLVSNAAGGGSGSVIDIDLSGVTPTSSIFASGFDYTGGLIVDGSRVLVSEAIDPSFESAIYEYSSAGVLQGTLSGPTYDHGSIDLAISADGKPIATGASTIVTIAGGGVETPLVTGLDGGTGFPAFGGGVSVDAFTGRIDFLASSFSGADDDKSVHRLVRIDTLVTGGGNPASDCAMELYGVELASGSPDRSARLEACVDGAPCDGDGVADGGCSFALGLCWNVSDPRLPDCTPGSVASLELLSAKPESAELTALVAAMAASLPSSQSGCVFSDGVRVPLRASSGGELRRGKATIRLRATTGDEMPHRDLDVARLLCEPPLP